MMDIDVDLIYWSIFFFDKKASGVKVKNERISKKKNYTNQLLENLIKKGTLIFYRQYLGFISKRYAIK